MYNIRVANWQDATAIASVHVACWRECYVYLPRGLVERRNFEARLVQWEERLLYTGQTLTLVLEQAGRVVGFGHVKRNDDSGMKQAQAELHACYFLPEMRGGSAGPAMMLRMVEWVAEQGFSTCGVWAWKQNPIRRTYAALGLEIVSRRDRVIDEFEAKEVGYLCRDLGKLMVKLRRMIIQTEARALRVKNQRSCRDRLIRILSHSGRVR